MMDFCSKIYKQFMAYIYIIVNTCSVCPKNLWICNILFLEYGSFLSAKLRVWSVQLIDQDVYLKGQLSVQFSQLQDCLAQFKCKFSNTFVLG